MHTSYRPDIDGLRAVAVVPVVLYHAGIGFPGGFTGVDIFFVISGYLITLGLLKDNRRGSFSLLSFYERRIRRIMPALTVVALCSFVFGLFVLLPSETVKLGGSLISAALFVSNIFFWDQQDYFADSNIANPLLHTWSLAVEEQFYIFWPVVIWLVFRFGINRWLILLTWLASLVSLIMAEWLVDISARSAFYLFPPRAWELLLGALLAMDAVPRVRSAKLANFLSLVAIGLIGYSLFFLSDSSRFPGISAIPACLGSAMLIHLGRDSLPWVNRLLTLQPVVWIGLISYSLYLWHWPIQSFAYIYLGEAPGLWLGGALAVLSVFCAYLSWRYVELPFRSKAVRRTAASETPADMAKPAGFSSNAIFAYGLGSIVAIALAGLSGVLTSGFPNRVNSQVLAIDSHQRQKVSVSKGCVIEDAIPSDFDEACLGGGSVAQSPVVLWGDSFARHHLPTLQDRYREAGIDPLMLAATGCMPLAGTVQTFGVGRIDKRCGDFNAAVLDTLARDDGFEVVILAGRWSNLAELGNARLHTAPSARYILDDADEERTLGNSLRAMEEALERTLAVLDNRGLRTVILKEPPRYRQNVRSCYARSMWYDEDASAACTSTLAEQREFRAPIDAIFDRLQDRFPDLVVYDPVPALCSAQDGSGRCTGYVDGVLLTEDVDHLSKAGSRLALEELQLPLADGRRSQIVTAR